MQRAARAACLRIGDAAGVGLLALVLALPGCTKTKQLESVAKDWCLTIRASQVIPVYPMTEDLQPGDIFLVQLPITEQHTQYKQRGFLPLDNHLGRLQPDEYTSFYGRSVVDDSQPPTLPRDWMRPSGQDSPWEQAPHAAFPEYTFEVRNGVGANIGVPIYGIPVGLSMMGSSSANGTVIIKDARTLGVDLVSLDRQVRLWGLLNADFLAPFGPLPGEAPRNYLRVLTRVYAIGSIEVFLSDASSGGGGVDAGIPRPVDLLLPNTATPAQATPEVNTANFVAAQEEINAALAAGSALGPGGSLRVNSASARTVGLTETFKRPLVIGYLGFDVAIGEGGALGAPLPTLALLEGRGTLAPSLMVAQPAAYMASRSAMSDIERALRDIAGSDQAAASALAGLNQLGMLVPPEYSSAQTSADGSILISQESPDLRKSGYARFRRYEVTLESSIAALEQAAQQRPLSVQEAAVLADARAQLEAPELTLARSGAERRAAQVYIEQLLQR
jgi:hypothetical protein